MRLRFSALRPFTLAVLVISALLFSARSAHAYSATVAFEPVTGGDDYRVRIAYDDEPWQPSIDLGRVTPESDGVVRVVVDDLPVGPLTRFTVYTYSADGLKSANSNELTLTYATVAAVVDSDGDGLRDAEEDTNLNGVVDPGETNPLKADTDGDGRDDRVELQEGTDPLVPDSPAGSTCGNGIVETGEECDDGNTTNNDACLRNCRAAVCGDGVVYQGVEECDDRNNLDTDACLSDCRRAVCGDGVVRVGVEQCDEGPLNSDIADGSCRTDCTLPLCAVDDAAETCDDENMCTDEICSGGQCAHTYNTSSCDDGVPCTVEDSCASGACVGRDACPTGEFCNLLVGECERAARPDDGLWMSAALYPSVEYIGGLFTSAKFAAGDDADATADSLNPLLLFADPETAVDEDAAVYFFSLPRSGDWVLWGRFYFPGSDGADANSFFITIDDGDRLKFGNSREFFRKWHWAGDGRVEWGEPKGLPLGHLAAGPHRIAVKKRETYPDSPRLDVLFLVDDPAVVPNDAAAQSAMSKCPFGGCRGGPVCGDANHNWMLSVNDAWTILNTAVGLGNGCRLALCDVDGDGKVDTRDAASVLQATVGIVDPLDFNCRGTVTFGLHDAIEADKVEFSVDYAGTGITFTNKYGNVTCRSAVPGLLDSLKVSDDTEKGLLSVAVKLNAPFTGSTDLLECRGRPPAGSQLPGPGGFNISLGTLSGPSGSAPGTVAVSPTL